MIRIGIYGYEFSKEAVFEQFKIIPVTNEHQVSVNLSADLERHNLTGFIEVFDEENVKLNQLTFDLEGVLSFIDQRDVIIQNQLDKDEDYNNLSKDFPTQIIDGTRNGGVGKMVMSDTFAQDSRKNFIQLALSKLTDENDPNNECFRKSFFKSIEVFRAKRTYLDVSYYLLFSAIESLSRSVLNNYKSSNSAVPITIFLRKYDFDVCQDNPRHLEKAISTYAHLRNSLFHKGVFYKDVNINGSIKRLNLFDYYHFLAALLPLSLMKYIEFDDGHVNWNGWLSRQLFK